MTNIRLRIAELEQTISVSHDASVTREMILDQIKKDAANISTEDIPRLIKAYVTKIYANNNEVIVTGGVNLNGCGGRI